MPKFFVKYIIKINNKNIYVNYILDYQGLIFFTMLFAFQKKYKYFLERQTKCAISYLIAHFVICSKASTSNNRLAL